MLLLAIQAINLTSAGRYTFPSTASFSAKSITCPSFLLTSSLLILEMLYVSRMYFNIALAAGSASFFCERIWSRSVTCLRSFSPFLVVIER